MITNPKRKKRISHFIDKNHEVMHEFYELTEEEMADKKLLKEMRRLIEEDPDFYDSYLLAADFLIWSGQKEEVYKLAYKAYERAVKKIADSEGQWPEEMLWGYLENRHLMRAIERQGHFFWEDGKVQEALEVFRKLLRCNPRDNQGVRHFILAILLGLEIGEWQKPFEFVQDGQVVGLDARKVTEWFEENAKKFPEEFDWWFEWTEKEG